ncbi:hypothetical protein [Rubripirellula reticaptiva]|uniref:Uncharacterized protein n=1 Tax=Rubripirellula reticaptiva TaxID=2528013 RepID=A0A5C6F6C5_9BACT|nr:hypothetical protein [Rubripirellula reticaptiva]TWU57253.1 hypothetical protein Poly59_01600 [Rubripirellula reticaptiva]
MANHGVKLTSLIFAAALLLAAASASTGQNQVPGTAPGAFASPETPNIETPTDGDVRTFLSTASGIPQMGVAGDMIGFSSSDGSGTQTITLVHTDKSWMAVYHIDRSGKIRLVSSRPIDADFSLQLNATSPLPEEIRQMGRR